MAVPQDLIFRGRALQRSAPWLGRKQVLWLRLYRSEDAVERLARA